MNVLPQHGNISHEVFPIDWVSLAKLPFDEWENTGFFSDINTWVQKVSNMTWSTDDDHFTQPQYTIPLMRLLRIIAGACSHELKHLYSKNEELERSIIAAHDAEEAIRARVELLRRENNDLRTTLEHKTNVQDVFDDMGSHSQKVSVREMRDIRHIKEKLDKSNRELDRLRHDNNELRQALQRRDAEKSHIAKEDEKFRLEYKHLVAKYKRLVEKSAKTEDMLREFQRLEKKKQRDNESELERIQRKLRRLQRENFELIQSRDQAEELCEQREAEALRDMTELQQLHRDIIDEEKQRIQVLQDELHHVRGANHEMKDTINELQHMLKQSEEENISLREKLENHFTSTRFREVETTGGSYTTEGSFSSSTILLPQTQREAPQTSRLEDQTIQKLLIERQKIQQENDRLSIELQQMEVRAEAQDAENIKIQRLLKEYEQGNEGIRRLRGELVESHRAMELLQEENAQLRERLNSMEDSLTFSAALQELCIRMGVTQDEIDRLRPKSTPLLSEVETLREEVSTLKEEVEWLEKERRYWMDKVRLQPLLDTKLRLELGLTSEQLKQLDHVVDQMRSGRLIMEENEENYKEKYFHELQLRRKEMEHFNDFVRQRIEEALREAFGKRDLGSTQDATSALQFLRERIATITAQPLMDESHETSMDVSHLKHQLRSALQLLEQSELTIKDNAGSQTALREQLAAVIAERDMLMEERDKYRGAVFEALGVNKSSYPMVDEGRPADEGEISLYNRSGNIEPPLPSSAEQVNQVSHPRTGSLVSITRTFEEQLRVKDELIASLKKRIEAVTEDLDKYRPTETKTEQELSEARSVQDELRIQVSALQQINEELNGKLVECSKTLEDLQEAMKRVESGNTRELLQKIVLLRQREGKLIQRLRRVMETQEEASRSEQTLREYVNTTFKSLKDALENTSTGFVLPRSTSGMCMENETLSEMHRLLEASLSGKLFKEDSAYLVQLQRVFHGIESIEELNALRTDAKKRKQKMEEMENEMSELRIEVERLQKLHDANVGVSVSDVSHSGKWETEATTWRQKCSLYMKRYEEKEREVSTLEADLEDARGELALLQEHLDNTCIKKEDNTKSVPAVIEDASRQQEEPNKEDLEERNKHYQTYDRNTANRRAQLLERDVARLKSINLGLLHHSLDLQGECKRLEIQLEATKQELSLVRDAGDSRKVSEFVSAAIRQHATLRRQSELALLRAKRSRMQLCATEANLRVAVNEGTMYKLSAFRLYRKYVEQVVTLLDYVRGVQRSTKGVISPHRIEMMHRRFLDSITDLESSQARQNAMTVQLAETNGMVKTLQEQLEILKAKDTDDRADVLHAKLLTALSAVREKDVQLAELKEDHLYMQQKLKRSEAYMQQLTEELTRLELRSTSCLSLDDEILQKLLQLKETVFAKLESPAIIIQPNETGSREVDDVEAETAIREYRQALEKQSELARECALLKKRLDDEVIESKKARAVTDSLKEEVNRLHERLQYTQRNLEEERQKAEERERRVIRSHEAQAEVTQRAAEHNNQCLRDMLKNKETCIKQLQEQLQIERKKYIEYQLGESVRMERLHDHLFKENNAMMERFREAISGVAENYTYSTMTTGVNTAVNDGIAEQLTLLTKETLRLKSELRDARATNILLEGKLNEQVTKAQQKLLETHNSDQCRAQQMPTGEASIVGVIGDQNVIIESLRQREFTLTRELQREKTEKTLLERQLYEVRQQIVEQGVVPERAVEPGTTGRVSVVEQELQEQLAFLESQLLETRAQLEEERQNAQQLQLDGTKWRNHLDALREEVVAQQADVESARQLVMMNDNLKADIRRVEEQNEKLVIATNMLKQRLLEEAQKRGDTSHKQQHELALAQRMGTIQLESTEQLKVVTERLRSIQRELEERVRHEEETLKKYEETQRMAYELHKQLEEKEREILRLQRELASRSSSSQEIRIGRVKLPQFFSRVDKVGQHSASKETSGTCDQPQLPPPPSSSEGGGQPQHQNMQQQEEQNVQPQRQQEKIQRPYSATPLTNIHTLITYGDANALAQPQIAALLRREVEKAQRDNLHEISSLRAVVRRLESDLEDSRAQLRGERETTRSLRAQIHALQHEREAKELAMARDCLIQQDNPKENQKMPLGRSKPLVAASVAPPPAAVPAQVLPTVSVSVRDKSCKGQKETEELRRQVEQITKRAAESEEAVRDAERYKKELEELRGRQLDMVDSVHMASPLDIRSHKRTVLHLEGIIESLQRELNVVKGIQLSNMRQRIDELVAENERLSAEMSRSRVASNPLSTDFTADVPVKSDKVDNREVLERELLEKNNTILDLRFEQEALQLKVGRLQRHIEDILKVDSTKTKRGESFQQRGRVEALESVVENLKLVVERLQHENNVLKSKTVSMSKHMDLMRELRELRANEKHLREHSEKLAKRLAGLASGGSAMSEQQAKLQRKLRTAQATVKQYHFEMLELKQKLDDRQEVASGNDDTVSIREGTQVEHIHFEDRRSVQPLDLWRSELPPPLPPRPRVTGTVDTLPESNLTTYNHH
ncbi:hypothetical protein LSM04_006935 [Trypanosoma melophagium]|uniref:uncharacterized protein n=1 Tax=Trypanosoma melophagium TaxID=715481 RepID=UPI00351A4066|nr:hypothetical protein LSM04_006935 [Trypanosoma melophagium]